MSKKLAIRILRISVKTLLFIVLGILVIFLGVYVYINTDSGKRFLTNKVQTFLAEKLKTKFTLGSVNYRLPNYFELNNIYLEDQNKDSLLYSEKLSVSIAPLKMIGGETDIKNVTLKNTSVNIYRRENDTNFNFQLFKSTLNQLPKSK